MSQKPQLIHADWPAPDSVKAFTTTRKGGLSVSAFQSMNLALHVGDKANSVRANRQKLQHCLPAHCSPYWLNQVHGENCVNFDESLPEPNADASFTSLPNKVLAVMTADCLPILLTDRTGSWVAACHAGWRGLAAGIVDNTVSCYPGKSDALIAWIGPALSQDHFEVGVEVREQFVASQPDHQQFFAQNCNGRYQFDFIGLAKHRLSALGIETYGGQHCSFLDKKRFYSYRRDGETGRMASVIWIENTAA